MAPVAERRGLLLALLSEAFRATRGGAAGAVPDREVGHRGSSSQPTGLLAIRGAVAKVSETCDG